MVSVSGEMELMGRGLKREWLRREWEELSCPEVWSLRGIPSYTYVNITKCNYT